jgi:hypothetical protein
VKITCNHSDELNMRAAFMLNGVHPPDEQSLIALFRSDVPLDRATRDAIADALQRKRGLRLKLVRAKGFQNKPALVDELKTIAEYQEIAIEVEAEAKSEAARRGIPAKRCLKHAKDAIAARRGISPAKVKDALSEARRTSWCTVRMAPH